MLEFDQRQYRLMLATLDSFLDGKSHIDVAISSLEGLLNALKHRDDAWKQSFLRLWGRLEDERAVALFRGAEVLDADSTQRTYDAANQLKLLVLEKIEDPNFVDPRADP